jgi:hypothetical protein
MFSNFAVILRDAEANKPNIDEGEHSKIWESSREKKLPTWMENHLLTNP